MPTYINKPPSKRTPRKVKRGRMGHLSPSRLSHAGEDWLDVTITGTRGPSFDDHMQTIERAKFEARAHGREWIELDMAGRCVSVSNDVFRLGGGEKGRAYAFYVSLDGVKIGIHKQRAAQLAFIRIEGRTALRIGAMKAYEDAKQWLIAIGARIEREHVSRVDIAIDFPGISPGPLFDAFDSGHIVRRAQKARLICDERIRSHRTLNIGSKRRIQLSLYDKAAECRAKHTPPVLMQKRRWGGRRPLRAMRVEFRLRRGKLTSRGISSVQDYIEKRAALLRYLTHDWIRFLARQPSKGHARSTPVHPVWRWVQKGFATWAGKANGQRLDPIPPEYDDTQLRKQLLGVAHTIAARRGCELINNEQLKQLLADLAHEEYGSDPKLVAIRQAEKRTKLRASP